MSAPAPAAPPVPLQPSPAGPSRIDLIDALRGSALLGLFLLHCVEHFDFSLYPTDPPAWLASVNKATSTAAYFLFGGKAYAIFAMMFGLSFFVIIDRAAERGLDFRARFLWRLGILTAIGYVFGLMYCGEILTMLALLGIPLAFLYRAPTRLLGWLSMLLLAQPQFWWQLTNALVDPAYTPTKLNVGAYYRAMYPVFEHGEFLDVLRVNAWTSVLGRFAWSIENGRYLQMSGLFLCGLLLGRSRIFENGRAAAALAWRAMLAGAVAFVVFYIVQRTLPAWDLPKTPQNILKKLTASYLNLAQMVVWVAGFILLYQLTRAKKILSLLAPFGRTSLTCYVAQNVIGVLLFYHFGAGLFRHWGEFYSLLYGFAFFAAQLALCHLWLRHFHYGPLEWLWRCLTLLSFKTPSRKTPQTAQASAVAGL